MKLSALPAVFFAAYAAAGLFFCASGLLGKGSARPERPLEQLHYETPRSECWKKAREEWLADYPRCEFKGCRTPLSDCEPHHRLPFKSYPDLECERKNLITLCRSGENHHLWIGHQGNFRESNRNVVADCAAGKYPRIGWERKQRHDAAKRR